jgi:cytidylate kinase
VTPEKPNIVISGLTAAGKTTHAKLLAGSLGYCYVSGTATLARMCGVETTEDPPQWLAIADAVAERRHDGIDEQLEEELLRLSREKEGQVFDVWALPWTSRDPRLVRIWIESTRLSRQAKCFISQGDNPERTLVECGTLIDEKDRANRELFLRTIGFDLFADHGVFHLKLDNTSFIDAPTREAADQGIAAFAPIVQSAVDVCMGTGDHDELTEWAHRYSIVASLAKKELA